MELFTLDPDFLKDEIVDEFISAIWTERYSIAGDVNLVVEASPANIARLVEGTFLGLDGTDEVMIIETVVIEKGKLAVTGPTLVAFLANRFIRTSPTHNEKAWPLTALKPGEIMTTIVQEMCIGGIYLAPGYLWNVDGPREIIPNLSIGDIDVSYADISIALPFGPVYDALKALSEQYHLGMSMYLESADESGYSLKFKSYAGRNLTSNQGTYPVVRLSPSMDTLADPKELRSISGFKNVAYTYASVNGTEGITTNAGVAFSDPDAETSEGFARRVLSVISSDVTIDDIGDTGAGLQALLNQEARNALANNNYVKVVDGEVVPQSEFQYGVNYLLGDIIELQGQSDIIQLARITEYIRSQDATGERSYPTVTVITEAERDGWFSTD